MIITTNTFESIEWKRLYKVLHKDSITIYINEAPLTTTASQSKTRSCSGHRHGQKRVSGSWEKDYTAFMLQSIFSQKMYLLN